MALIGNYTILQRLPIRRIGGLISGERSNVNTSGQQRNIYFNDGGYRDDKDGLPSYGLRGVYSNNQPRTSGGLSSRYNGTDGQGLLNSANLAGGLNAEAGLSGIGQITSAIGDLVVQAVAALSGTGIVSDAQLQAILNAAADLTGSGTLAGDVTALNFALANLAGTTAVDATLNALGTLASDITPFTELSPESLAAAVWNALAASYNDAGTMGAALADAGGAGNPWSALLSGNNDPGSFGERVQKLLTTGKFLGLK